MQHTWATIGRQECYANFLFGDLGILRIACLKKRQSSTSINNLHWVSPLFDYPKCILTQTQHIQFLGTPFILFVVPQLAYLFVLLLQLLTNLLNWHAPRQWLGQFSQDSSGGIFGAAEV